MSKHHSTLHHSTLIAATALALAAGGVHAGVRTDSQRRTTMVATADSMPAVSLQRFGQQEQVDMRSRMLTTAQPVAITQRGRHLCVESTQRQLLPVYTSGGVFYTAFRLQKGMNWLNGLPRGTYIINNRRFTIS